ncbi:MAG TPA: hypothetical protein VEB87_05515 [Nitrososphaerales archaeon]|nr:hypothetical protein [Nitrososphaerales archaeon]
MSQKFLLDIDPIRFFLGFLAVGLALGFLRYFDQWVYFPLFPNILDSATMAFIGIFLLWDVLKKVRANARKDETTKT